MRMCPAAQPSVSHRWTLASDETGSTRWWTAKDATHASDPDPKLFYEVVRGGWSMLSPYGMEIVESCLTCKLRADRIFCDLPDTALQAFEKIKFATSYPQDAVLFVEGQMPRGIFVICKGSVKLSINSPGGRTMIVKLAEAGEVLGLSATISGKPYEVTAETIDPCQVTFVKREDFLGGEEREGPADAAQFQRRSLQCAQCEHRDVSERRVRRVADAAFHLAR